MVSRPRLLALLEGAESRRLTLITGDSGHGKSTLLAQWAPTMAPLPQVWHGLRTIDGPPKAFERRLTDLFTHLLPLRRTVRSVAEALEALDTHGLLVLDDAHLLAPKAHTLLGQALEHPLVHLVIASRTPLGLPLARLRLQGQMREITAADLAFTPEEIAALGVTEDAAAVWARTQGWAAAVALIRLSGSLPAATTRGELFTLLAEEVWSGLRDEERRVLEAVAVAGNADVQLAAALSGQTSAGTIMERHTHRGWLSASSSGRYACHPLMREFIVRQMAPDARAALAGEALSRLVEQREWVEAAQVSAMCERTQRWEFLGQFGHDVARHGGAGALRQALDDLPHDATEPARVTMFRGRLELLEGRFAEALPWLFRALDLAAAREDWLMLSAAAAFCADVFGQRGRYDEAARILHEALTTIGDQSEAARAEVQSVLPWSLFHIGRTDDAFAVLQQAADWYEHNGTIQQEALCLRRRAALHALRGETGLALRHGTRALGGFQRARDHLGEAVTRMNLAMALGHAGRFGEGIGQAEAALAIAERAGLIGPAREIALVLAGIRVDAGRNAGPPPALLESERYAFLWHLLEVRHFRRAGNLTHAWQAAGAARALTADLTPHLKQRLQAEEAALKLSAGEDEDARRMLEEAVEAMASGTSPVDAVLPRLHRAIARLRTGDRAGAMDDLARLLDRRTESDLAALWSQEAWAAAPLLGVAVEDGREAGFASALLATLRAPAPTASEAIVRIEVLGPLRVQHRGEALPDAFERPQVRALLAYLAVHHPRPIPASELLEALWPQAGAVEESSLYSTVSRLRRVVGRETVVRDGTGYRLSPDAEVDALDFDLALRRDPPQWRDAMDLYRADLVADMPLAEWCFLARESYRSRFLDAATRYGEAALTQERFDEARRAFERAQAADPLYEPAVQGLIRVFILLGNAPAALQLYQRFAAAVERELGVLPGEETQHLAQRLLAPARAS